MNTKHVSDQVLIDSYKNGEETAINILIDRHRHKIFNYVLMLVKNTDIADDISQELFIKVIHSIKSGKYADNGKFLSWALRIAHNMVIDYFRSQKQKSNVSIDGEINILNNKSLSEEAVEEKLINEQTENDIRKLVDHLPLEQREVVIMRHYLGLSFKEIAEQTGVSINTALGRMRYALLNMRKMINENNLSMNIAGQ